MVTAPEKKKRLNQIEKSIKENPEPLPYEQLVSDMIYQYGMERRKAREYLDAMSRTTESEVVDITVPDSDFGYDNHDYEVFMVEETDVEKYKQDKEATSE